MKEYAVAKDIKIEREPKWRLPSEVQPQRSGLWKRLKKG